jgi:hypothetical protein
MHEPKAPVAFHKEDAKESRGRGGDLREGRRDDSASGVPVDEPHLV